MRKLLLIMTLCGLFATLVSAGGQDRDDTPSAFNEVETLRTEKSETFSQRGKSRMTRMYQQSKYYKSGNEFREVDLTERDRHVNGFTRAVEAGPYVYRHDPAYKSKGSRFERDEYYATYTPTGNWTGITSETTIQNTSVKEVLTILDGAESVVSWTVETNAGSELIDGELRFTDIGGNVVFRVLRPWAEDAEQRNILVAVTYSESILTYTLDIPEDAVYPLLLDPSTTVDDTPLGTGLVMTMESSYDAARNTQLGYGTYSSDLSVGLWTNGATYKAYRSFLTFDTSSLGAYATVDSAKLVVATYSIANLDSDFDMYLVNGTFSGSMSKGWINDFDGWQSSGAYSITYLANTVNTSGAYVGSTFEFKFNGSGLNAISKTGNTTLAILQSRDANNQAAVTYEEFITLQYATPYLQIWYTPPPVEPPTNFSMTALSDTSIACTWTDNSDNEDNFYIVNTADSSAVATVSANAVADTINGLSANTLYTWSVYADSSGVTAYSDSDSEYTLLPDPGATDAMVRPVSSDSLKVAVTAPNNSSTDQTAYEVNAVSGWGATDSGWLSGDYEYLDGGLDPDSTYVYRLRLRNAAGVETAWSPNRTYVMRGLDMMVIGLSGDSGDDYNVDFGAGQGDSTYVRAGSSDTGEKLDGFLSFEIPWQVYKGGVDSMFVTMTRVAEGSGDALSINVYGIPVIDIDPVEEIDIVAQDSTGVTISWTISSGAGAKTSPTMRDIIREWQDLGDRYGFRHGLGLRFDDSGQTTGIRAVFLDASHQSYAGDTKLTVYYTPGEGDSLNGDPSGFNLTVLGPDSLRAGWTDNATTEYGYILMNSADSTAVAGTDTLAVDTTTLDVGNLTPNTLYEWFVKAVTGEDEAYTGAASGQSLARTPGSTTVTALSDTTLGFVIDPVDNPSWTAFAVQDSLTGLYIDGDAEPDTLRQGPPGDWGWKSFADWGSALGDTLTGLTPDSLFVIRAKARTGGGRGPLAV